MKRYIVLLLCALALTTHLGAELPNNLDGKSFFNEYKESLMRDDTIASQLKTAYEEGSNTRYYTLLHNHLDTYLRSKKRSFGFAQKRFLNEAEILHHVMVTEIQKHNEKRERRKNHPYREAYKSKFSRLGSSLLSSITYIPKEVFGALPYAHSAGSYLTGFANNHCPIPVTPKTLPRLYKAISELAQKLAIPTPILLITNDDHLLAHARAHTHDYAIAFVTEKMLRTFTDGELLSTLAHEFSHIKHLDSIRMQKQKWITRIGLGILAGILAKYLKSKGWSLLGASVKGGLVWTLAQALVIAYQKRKIEHEADVTSLEAFNFPRHSAQRFKKYRQENPEQDTTQMSLLKGLLHKLFASHPTYAQREAFFKSKITKEAIPQQMSAA